MGIRKLWMGAVGTAAAALVLAGCSSGAQLASAPATGESAPASSSTAAPTTAPPVSSTTTKPPAPSKTTTTTPKKPATPKKTAQPAVNPSVPCSITEGACVDISAGKAWLLSGGKVVYGPVSVTTGRKANPTPTGMFHVLSKEKVHLSKEFNNAPMPNSVFFYPGDAFHTGSLVESSHGCVHLSSSASLKFFSTLQVGDPVQIVP